MTGSPPPHPIRRLPGQAGQADDDFTLVVARGDLDIATVDQLDRTLRSAVTDDQPDRHLVLDLAEVAFLDCCALGALVATRNRLHDRFWLANPPAQVERLLELTGLDGAFGVIHGSPAIRLVSPAGPVLPVARVRP